MLRFRFNADGMFCDSHTYGFGASADSAYEYMLKQWLMSGKKDEVGCGLDHCL